MYICEDEPQQLKSLVAMIEKYIMIENLDMQVVQAVTTPAPLLQDLDDQHQRLYFLDIDLGQAMSGIKLANRIRQVDVNCKLVFVTTHAELALETLQYQLEPLAFILKDQPDNVQGQVIQAIQLAQQRWQQASPVAKPFLTFKTIDQLRTVQVAEILYFETAKVPHKLIVHLANAHFEIYGTIKTVAKQRDEFYRCQQSIVVNCQHVKAVNQQAHVVTLSNGEQVPCSLVGGRGLVKQLR